MHIQIVLDRLQNAGFTINLEKSQFVRNEIEYLGHTISKFGVTIDKKKICAIEEFPEPKNPKMLKSFFGICGYSRRFIPNFATIAAPLYKIEKKTSKWLWSDKENNAFKTLKNMFVKYCCVQHPDSTSRFIVQTDSSYVGVGAVLYQIGNDKVPRIIAFASRLLKSPEVNDAATELEALAIVWALDVAY